MHKYSTNVPTIETRKPFVGLSMFMKAVNTSSVMACFLNPYHLSRSIFLDKMEDRVGVIG